MSERLIPSEKSQNIEMSYLGDLRVLEAITTPSANRKTAVIFMGGGQRTITSLGVADALVTTKIADNINYYIGTSAGAVIGYYLAANKIESLVDIMISDMATHRLINPRNLWQIVNVEVMEHLLRNGRSIDHTLVRNAKPELFIGLTDMYGNSLFISAKEKENIVPFLLATLSHPLVTGGRGYFIEGQLLYDGCIASPLPLKHTITDLETTDILVVLTRSPFEKSKPGLASILERVNALSYGPALKNALQTYEGRLQLEFDHLKNFSQSSPAVRILTIFPQSGNLHPLTMDVHKMMSAYLQAKNFMLTLLSSK